MKRILMEAIQKIIIGILDLNRSEEKDLFNYFSSSFRPLKVGLVLSSIFFSEVHDVLTTFFLLSSFHFFHPSFLFLPFLYLKLVFEFLVLLLK
jgi:hypothetical protein